MTSARLSPQLTSIRNFQSVSRGIYRGAQPNSQGLEDLKDLGIKTIVSLRIPPQVIEWEAAMADQLDMNFVSLPLSTYERPSASEVREFLKIVTDPTRQPVFVHCRQGQMRTGAMIASYRVLHQGWTVEQAYAEAKQLGFHDRYPWYLPLKWFIWNLDDSSPLAIISPPPLLQ